MKAIVSRMSIASLVRNYSCVHRVHKRLFSSSCDLKDIFENDGFIGSYEIIPEKDMGKWKNRFNELESIKSGRLAPQEINCHIEHKFIMDLCLHPTLLSCVETLIGSDIVILSTTIVTKYPLPTEPKLENYSGEFVGWHQDLKYWGLTSLRSDNKIPMVTAWIAIDGADEENGAIQFVAGSHKVGFFEHIQSSKENNILNENQDILLTDEWKQRVVQTVLRPGECSFHDGMLVHGSGMTMRGRRMGFAIHFCAPCVKMGPMSYTKTIAFDFDYAVFKPVLVSGFDNFGGVEYYTTKEDLFNTFTS